MNQEIKKIHTLAELKEEKEKLRREIAVSKTELIRSFGITKSYAKSIVLKGIVLPASLLGITVAGVKAVQALNGGYKEKEEEEYLHYSGNPPSILESVKANLATSPKWYMRLIPFAMQLVGSFLTNRNNYQQEDVIETYPTESIVRQGQRG